MKKLIEFDTQRVAYYTQKTHDQWSMLTSLRKDDDQKDQLMSDEIDNIEDKIETLQLRMQQMVRNALDKIRNVQRKDEEVMKLLIKDEKLDKEKLDKEKVEEEFASKIDFAQTEDLNDK